MQSLKARISRVRARGVRVFLFRVALALVGLELAYLLAANAVLASDLVRGAVGSADGIQLRYAAARSWFPGRVHVRDLELVVEDYNVQFRLAIGRARLDISLHELFAKRLHVTHLLADEVSFRMRHKLHGVGKNGPRLAAYPPIAGFSDPPLYRGPPPPPTANPESLWALQVEDVLAHVRELWILEYRFQGDAQARGSFLLRPALRVRVEPAALQFHAGSLSVAGKPVARQVKGEISFSMPDFDVQATEGKAIFRQISSRLQLALKAGDLAFLDVYTLPRGDLAVRGAATWSVDWEIRRGVVTEGSKVTLDAPGLVLATGLAELQGAADLSLSRRAGEASLTFDASLRDAVLKVGDSCEAPPELTRWTSSLGLEGVDLSRPIGLGKLAVSASARAPELACLNGLSTELQLGGSAEAEIELDRDAAGHGEGRAVFALKSARFAHGNEQFRGDLDAQARFHFDKTEQGSPYAQGAVSVHLSSAGSLLSFAVAPLFRKLIAGTLGLDELQGTVAFYAEREKLRLELTRLQSGSVTAKGHWQVSAGGKPHGAVLLSSGPINVGVKLAGSETDVTPLVSDSWLEDG